AIAGRDDSERGGSRCGGVRPGWRAGRHDLHPQPQWLAQSGRIHGNRRSDVRGRGDAPRGEGADPMTETITIRRPDDWHVHVRDGEMLRATLPFTAKVFGRAIIMPNLVPPVRTLADLAAYRGRIEQAIPAGSRFRPRLTLYLTETTDPEGIRAGAARGELAAVKLYPAGATTNSDSGVRDIGRVTPMLEAMQEADVPLLVHGEVT